MLQKLRHCLLLTLCLPALGRAATLKAEALLCEFAQPLATVVDEGWEGRTASGIMQAARVAAARHEQAGREAFAQVEALEKQLSALPPGRSDEALEANLAGARITSHAAGEQAAPYLQILSGCTASGARRLRVDEVLEAQRRIVRVRLRGFEQPRWVLQAHLSS